jgi:K+-transporting ATPase ATPase C chain
LNSRIWFKVLTIKEIKKRFVMKAQLFISLRILLVLSIITGIAYPLLMTGVAQLVFPARANGSLVWKEGKTVGSELIGQPFDSSIYFWSRPSATGYNPIPSGASNLGPTSEKLAKQVEERRELFLKENLLSHGQVIPLEMIFASASGLDPHISPEAAILQLERVAMARGLNEIQKNELRQLIANKSEKPQFSLFGRSRINVFKLNLALDNIK